MTPSQYPVRVIVSHPARQGNIYYRPRAAEQMGAHVTFLTGLYYRPDRFPYCLVNFLPDHRKARMNVLLEKRRLEGLSPENVISLLGPLLEITLRPAGRYREWGAIHDWLASKWITRHIRKTEPAVVHVFDGACQRTLRATSRFKNTIRLMELTLPPAPGATGGKLMAGLKKELNQSDFVLVQSEYSAQFAMSVGVEAKRIIRCHLGVDTSYFQPRTTARRPGPLRFLFLGGTSRRKGLGQLLEAWRRGGNEELRDAELILAGNRTGNIGDMLQGIPNCRVLGHVPDDQFVALLQDADVLVHPSWAEGGCNVVYEALACGLPCVVSTNATSAVRNNIDGIVFPVGSVEMLQACMTLMVRDPEVRGRMGVSARQRAVSLRWEKYLIRVAAIYKGLAQHAIHRNFDPLQTFNFE